MPISDWIHLAAATATIFLLIAAGFTDITRYRIPNVIVYAIVVAFVVGAAFNISWPALGWSALAAIGMFLLGAGLFALGLFGGGDVKLIAAMALWTGVGDLLRFLLVMSIAGGLLGAVWLVRRRRQAAPPAGAPASSVTASSATVTDETATSGTISGGTALSTDAPSRPKIPNKLPYGVAIAIAGLDFFIMSPHSPFVTLWPWAS